MFASLKKAGPESSTLCWLARFSRTQTGGQPTSALMIGSNQTHIWQIENGTVNVGLDLLCRLADALEVNVRDLIDF